MPDCTVVKKGWVIDFHAADGYGFVRTEDDARYLFLTESFHADTAEMPTAGRYVTVVAPAFAPAGRTPRLHEVRLDLARLGEEAPQEPTPDTAGRMTCPHCRMSITPRLFYNNGLLEGSLCPFCLKSFRVNEPLPESGTPSNDKFWQAMMVTLILNQTLDAILDIDLDA